MNAERRLARTEARSARAEALPWQVVGPTAASEHHAGKRQSHPGWRLAWSCACATGRCPIRQVNDIDTRDLDEADNIVTTLSIDGEAADSAPTFTSAPGRISARPATEAVVEWEPAPWPTIGAAGPDQGTSGLSTIMQEIVDRPRWSSGNALVITTPVLHIEYQ